MISRTAAVVLLTLLTLMLWCGCSNASGGGGGGGGGVGSLADCPVACECKWRGGKESAICAGANLTAVPRHLNYGTQLLDLTGNPLYRLGKDAFADAELLNLQKLYLSRCRLKAVDRYAFRGLNNLVELDLSHNSIPAVPAAALESVPELRELRLNGNPIMRLPNGAFARVPRLVRLDVSGCRVALLESTAFAGLENSLEWLRLDGNQLRDLRPATVVSLARLHGVRLDDNPWNCSCKLRPLREWMARRNVPYGAPPVCKTPARLARAPWDELELDDFACHPHSVPVSPVVVVTEGDNATVSCRMYGVPVPSSRWTRNDRPVVTATDHGESAPSTAPAATVPVTEGRYTNLTIVSAGADDGGSYACELENRSGTARSNVTVVVVKRSSPRLALASDRYALPGLIVGAILALSLCLIVLCGLAIRTKGSPTRLSAAPVTAVDRGVGTTTIAAAATAADTSVTVESTGDRRCAVDRYEKIEMNYDVPAVDVGVPRPLGERTPPTGYVEPTSAADTSLSASDLPRRRYDDGNDNGYYDNDDGHGLFTPSVTDRPTARPSGRPVAAVTRRPRILPESPKDGKTKTYLECNLGEVTLHHHVLHKEPLPAGHLYTTAAGRQDLCNARNVPDLLDTLMPAKSRRISQTLPRSTGLGSNNSRRNTMLYTAKSSGSQSPLLLGSRSSGGSNTSRSQLSFDSSVSSDHPIKQSLTGAGNRKSNSYGNLSVADDDDDDDADDDGRRGRGHRGPAGHRPPYCWTPPSLPSSPARERRLPAVPPVGRGHGTGPAVVAAAETPILDPLSTRRRPYSGGGGGRDRNRLTGSSHSLLSLQSDGAASVTYDYHAAQLDMFLDEYKTLRNELTKMQRTCDTLRLSNASLASSVPGPADRNDDDDDGGNVRRRQTSVQLPVPAPPPPPPPQPPSAPRSAPKSILKNKNHPTYVYRTPGDRRNSFRLSDPAPGGGAYLS